MVSRPGIAWREVEVELGPAGKKKDLKRARKLLHAAGATPSTSRTKLDRALGRIAGRAGLQTRGRHGRWAGGRVRGGAVRCARQQ